MDVHTGRLCRILGLYDDKMTSLSTALKVTHAFAQIEPAKPGKYGFALSRLGIPEDCVGRPCLACGAHELLRFRATQTDSLASAG